MTFNDDKKENIAGAPQPAEDQGVIDRMEKDLIEMRAENARRAARIADMKKQMNELMAVKYAALCNLTHVGTGSGLQPELGTMRSKIANIIRNLNKLVEAKNKMDRTCDDNCKKAVEAKESLVKESSIDEFTAMPYQELKKCISEVSKKVAKIREETSSKTEELLIKKKSFLETKKSLLGEIRDLAHVERDAKLSLSQAINGKKQFYYILNSELIEDLKSEISIQKSVKKLNCY